MKKIFTLWFLAAVVIAGCKDERAPQDPAGAALPETSGDTKVVAVENPEVSIGELTFAEVESEVFAGTGTSATWDGQPRDEARTFLSMTVGGQCGEGNCGKQVHILNSHSEKSIRAVITIPYQLAGTSGYIAREYTLPPGEKTPVGCSHLCDGENSVEFKRAIVVAEVL